MNYAYISKCLGWMAVLLVMGAAGRAQTLPFQPGEKFYYEVRWETVPVARVSLEVGPFEYVRGEEAFHFVFRARTYPAVEILFPVDGYIEAFTDRDLTRSLKLQKDMREGRSQRIFQVDFDWERNIATYTSQRKRKRRIPLPEGTLDMLSILYYACSLPLETGLEVSRPLNSGKKTLLAKASVVRRETILVDGRLWPAFLINPDIREAGGVFAESKAPELTLWISADERRIPLKVVSKVWLGAFIIELTTTPPESDRLS